MAQFVRVRFLEKPASKQGAIKNRISRMEAILKKSENLLLASKKAFKEGKVNSGASMVKRARDEARMASRLIGILMIEFGQDMTRFAMRTRNIFREAREIRHVKSDRSQ